MLKGSGGSEPVLVADSGDRAKGVAGTPLLKVSRMSLMGATSRSAGAGRSTCSSREELGGLPCPVAWGPVNCSAVGKVSANLTRAEPAACTEDRNGVKDDGPGGQGSEPEGGGPRGPGRGQGSEGGLPRWAPGQSAEPPNPAGFALRLCARSAPASPFAVEAPGPGPPRGSEAGPGSGLTVHSCRGVGPRVGHTCAPRARGG